MGFNFDQALLLFLLPLAALPLFRRRDEFLGFSSFTWLPQDRSGRWLEWLWRGFAALAMASIIVGLASPGQSGVKLERTGRGAEVLIMLDRSSSMDAVPRRKIVGGTRTTAGKLSTGESKNFVARELLTKFVSSRPNDRFSLMTFSTKTMLVAPFADQNDAVLAGLAATGIGRGLPRTDLGTALLSAIEQFKPRSYSGSRVILIVSDGGANLDEQTKTMVSDGLTRNRIGVYFIYVRSTGSSSDLNAAAAGNSTARIGEEVALHRFFLSLETPYSLFETEDSKAMAKALAVVDREQNLPLTFFERVPRQDFSNGFFWLALVAGGLLLISKSLTLRPWK